MSKTYLLLWLEGPFQSWGDDSRFGRRESLKFPTKSALCGMVCASMGARREQKELLCELSQTKVSVLTFTKRTLSTLCFVIFKQLEMVTIIKILLNHY